ncbi:MAG TPA: hypothetical protein VLG47_02240 [Candidatus Saccharimonadales bacterium]|nr:hypothetical protein [Candidatus Saccharimonadales bacterium]
MIRKKSDDPDVEDAARDAYRIVKFELSKLPHATKFDYSGHILKLDDYGMCTRCSGQIAEAQAAQKHLLAAANRITDPTVKEHVDLAAKLLFLEAEAAKIRAEFHNGHGTEPILNEILGFLHDRNIHDSYDHSHNGGS